MSGAQDIVANNSIKLRGVVGIYAAGSVGDDIQVFADAGREHVAASFHGLRQQAEKDDSKEPYLCLSDFIAPKARAPLSCAMHPKP